MLLQSALDLMPTGPGNASARADDAFQARLLQGVSRTFALTIPVLPSDLMPVVANAYLLCRIVDTIEDEPQLSAAAKRRLCENFVEVVAATAQPEQFCDRLAAALSSQTSAAEHELAREAARVVRITHRLSATQQEALYTCVRVMSQGMVDFQQRGSTRGLADLAQLDRYCYHVAGVVGEMLTRLFCEHSAPIAARREELLRLAVSFGQGLQMTNILKDIWEDRARGFCWLPRDHFPGLDLEHLVPGADAIGFRSGLARLVAIAHGHLHNAMQYTLLIPARETGIRNFCLWAIGMALLTLRKIQSRLDFAAGEQVKISRRSVKAVVVLSRLAADSDAALRTLFRLAGAGLPVVRVEARAIVAPAPELRQQRPDAAAPPAWQLDQAIASACAAVCSRQQPDGHWRFPLEADCTIPAEYVLMMHYLGEVDTALQSKIAVYLRERQAEHGGWPLYYGGAFDLSCSVKAYYALKLAGDDCAAPHLIRAREAIIAHGGAVRVNVFTRITLALFGQVPWRAVPFMPVELMLLPRWFPFHLSKISYWSRTVLVPLLVLCTLKPRARNLLGVHVNELFLVPAQREENYFPVRSPMNRAFIVLDRLGRAGEPLVPGWLRRRALRRAEAWFIERLNGSGGLGAIFPAMVNALEALECLGYPAEHALRRTAREAIDRLLVVDGDRAYCQPCVSPVWDSALATLAVHEAAPHSPAIGRALDWLLARQLREQPGDWRQSRPALPGGGWPFQYHNDFYPDVDDTSAVVWAMQAAGQPVSAGAVQRALRWICGMQSRNGGFASFDVDNTHAYLNEIPFADHGALLDPPSVDVSARCVSVLARAGDDPQCARALSACVDWLRQQQEPCGAWFGRWGTNYIYGTWSVLVAFELAGMASSDPAIRRAVSWLIRVQRDDGGWGEDNDTYLRPHTAGTGRASTSFQTAWAMLALIAAGETGAPVQRGAEFLLRAQRADGLWQDPWFTAPGFPRVFFLKYHGYDKYFPLWALARYRRATGAR